MSKYVDANIFLNPVLYKDGKAEKCREILRQITGGEIAAVTSFLTWDEFVHVIRKQLGREIATKEGDKFLKFPNLTFLKVDENVIFKAQELIAEYNVKPRDAIHAASALAKGIREIISDDPDFDKIKELKRIRI
ncbi:type II toxin-antitoxin system VapC family toxin [Candidatus Pacearchaeota archaeon]|nr:type II toxin-antitoxin system VapC family toxin [Candidatus Pacearchaeota archaeon]